MSLNLQIVPIVVRLKDMLLNHVAYEAAYFIYRIRKELGHEKTGKIASNCTFPIQYARIHR
jgi:hypothetical protein